jgi:signal peptidase I
MIPTLQVGDHIFVNKFIYGPAIPFTHSRVWTHMPPERGDVIVHAYPENMEQDFIKRVIAVPGDVLEAKSGHPWLNGWEVPHCFVGVYSYSESSAESEMPSSFQRHEGDLFVEYLGDKSYLTLYDHATGGYSDHQGPFRARPGEVWVMGDNRNNSHDSRMWWNYKGGGVPFENIRGRALFVWLSTFDGKSDWGRLGTPVMGRPRLPADMANLEPAMEKCFRDRPPLAQTTPPPPPREADTQLSGPDTDDGKHAR